MSDICSLILPRPIFIESGEKDIIFPIEVVKKSVLALKKRGSVEHLIFSGAHRFCGEGMVEWFEKHLKR
jgi:fermentation-respiration switch protein FrsA (DUF1100 family)